MFIPFLHKSYYRRDHLGSNVAVWDATADSTVQRTIYYASGLPMRESTGQEVQTRKYNGKEYVEDHGFDVYDYGFRGYYATIGRFTSIDPLAEQTPWQSPYVYANNNFINNVDYWGLFAKSIAGLHTDISVPILNWVAMDKDGNVVGWGDDEDDNHVYLVDEFWDGTYAGLADYDIIGWEIGAKNYTLNQPCLYLGFYNIGNVSTTTKEGSQPILCFMYGNHPATMFQIEQGLEISWLYDLMNSAFTLIDDVFTNRQKAFMITINTLHTMDKSITQKKIDNIELMIGVLSIKCPEVALLSIAIDIYLPWLIKWIEHTSSSFQQMFNQHLFDTYGGLPDYYK